MKHNHITRDIRPLGECPACDLYHWENRAKTLTGGIKFAISEIDRWFEEHDPDFTNQEMQDIQHHLMGSITDQDGNVMEDDDTECCPECNSSDLAITSHSGQTEQYGNLIDVDITCTTCNNCGEEWTE